MGEPALHPSKRKGVLLIGVVFVLGMICGAALFVMGQRSVGFRRPPGPPPGHPLDRLSRELNLDDAQREEIRTILDGQRARLDAVLEDSRHAIRAVLRPDQQERFDDLRPPRPGGPEEHPGHPPPGHPPPFGAPPPPPPPPERSP
jgi:hypothetical protein